MAPRISVHSGKESFLAYLHVELRRLAGELDLVRSGVDRYLHAIAHREPDVLA